MGRNVNLYFWALLPDDPIQRDITRLKEEASARFQSSRALRAPAHVTLIPPIRVRHFDLNHLQKDICAEAGAMQPFNLNLIGVRGFPKRVVYIHVDSSEPLNSLASRLASIRARHFPQHRTAYSTFNPHVTLAFRDLTPDKYAEALRYFQTLDLSFSWEANRVYRLVSKTDGWHIDSVCPFGTVQTP